MFMMITFPWPLPMANVPMTVLGCNSDSIRVPDLLVDYLEPAGAENSVHGLDHARIW